MVTTSVSMVFRSVWLSASRCLTVCDRRGGLFEPRGQRVLHRRDFRDAAAGGLYLRVEVLKPDQVLDIGIHVGTSELISTVGVARIELGGSGRGLRARRRLPIGAGP